jgi:hypothetical protein
MLIRWYRADQPLQVATPILHLADLAAHLPPGTQTVTPEERKSEIRTRHLSTLRRYAY